MVRVEAVLLLRFELPRTKVWARRTSEMIEKNEQANFLVGLISTR